MFLYGGTIFILQTRCFGAEVQALRSLMAVQSCKSFASIPMIPLTFHASSAYLKFQALYDPFTCSRRRLTTTARREGEERRGEER